MVPHTNVDCDNPWIERITGVPDCQHTTNPTKRTGRMRTTGLPLGNVVFLETPRY